jgi:hypothetical protein
MAAVAQNASPDEQASERVNTAILERYMTDVQTELTGKVDTRDAAVGQEVTARTRDAATLADGTALPKGTRLVGHVIRVTAQGKDQPIAMLAITFDRAQLQDGSSVALRSEIRTVGPPAGLAAKPFAAPGSRGGVPMGGGVAVGGGPMSDDPMGGGVDGAPPASVGGSGTTGTRGGGGGGGGGLGDGQVGLGGNLPGQTTRTIGQRTGMTPDMAGGGSMPVDMAGETTSTAPRATALRGVMLSNSAGADVSGVLMASGQNISLSSGTQITLGMISNQPARPAR